MPKYAPHGNLTATLLVVALFELIVDRLLGRLFLSPGCHSGFWCLLLRTGPFLLHLTGALTLVLGVGAIVGHLRRGELFPRGMRLTIAALSMIFMLLLALSLLFGRIPDRYHIHLETSFAFVVALLALSFMGVAAVSARARVGFLLFALPPLLHVAALVAARGGWLGSGPVNPERLTSVGEIVLLLAALTAPVLLIPHHVPRTRMGAALAFAAGVAAFFLVAFVGRTDLVQTVALYAVQLELPRALSAFGLFYVLALFGFVTAAAVLLLSPGPGRLTGLGMCLIGVAGYQTSSPVALGLSLCGLLSLATGSVRSAESGARRGAPLSAADWRSLLESIAAAVAEQSPAAAQPPAVIELGPADEMAAGTRASGSDTAVIRVARRGRPVELNLRRDDGWVRGVDVTVGILPPGDTPAVATIESHEVWLGRRPEERVPLPRMKTGDLAFDRKIGVHGRAPVAEPEMRRRLLRLADGTITLFRGAARFAAPGNRAQGVRRFGMPVGSAAVQSMVDVVDTLTQLIEADERAAPPDAAA